MSKLECCAERFVEARDEAINFRELLCGDQFFCFVVAEPATSDVLRYTEVTCFLPTFVGGVGLFKSDGAAGRTGAFQVGEDSIDEHLHV